MDEDTLKYDSMKTRPLPKWLIDQKAGLTKTITQTVAIKEDRSLGISLAITGVFILLVIAILTVYIVRKHRKKSHESV
jgi:hypothetical protein